MKSQCIVFLWLALLAVVLGSKSNRQRTLVYRGQIGSLTDQFLELKRMLLDAEAQKRHLVVVQSKDESSGLSSFNLCDIFELPSIVSCEKHMKFKCGNSTATDSKEESHKQKQKKKVSFHCEPAVEMQSAQHVSNAVDLFSAAFPAKLLPKRHEEVEYMQAMLGLVSKQANISPYTVIYWGQASQYLGRDIGQCVYSAVGDQQGNDACRQMHTALAQLVKSSQPYCTNAMLQAMLDSKYKDNARDHKQPDVIDGVRAEGSGLCYIAGATQASAVEAKLMLGFGLQSFRGAWTQHQEGTQLVHINPVSVEIMELGLMLGAFKFVSLTPESLKLVSAADSTGSTMDVSKKVAFKQAAETVLVTSFVEHERAREGKIYCTAHRDGVNPSDSADVSFCGRLAASNYVYKVASDHANDDGPFENPTLNKFVVNLALSLLGVFSSRILQLGLGFITVVLILGVFRLCYTRWKRTSTKTV